MAGTNAIQAISDRIIEDGLTLDQIAELYAALPPRTERTYDEHTVSVGIIQAYRRAWAAQHKGDSTFALVDIIEAQVEADGTYVDRGEGMAPIICDAAEGILEDRYADPVTGERPDHFDDWSLYAAGHGLSLTESPREYSRHRRAFWFGKVRRDALANADAQDPTLWQMFENAEISGRELVHRYDARKDY